MTYSATRDEYRAVYELWPVLDKTKLPRSCINLARDSYDDCLGYIDEQLGLLFDELQRRGVLDQTLIVVTSDHGEGLGEHNLFDHGESLYRTEIRVPLVIVPPSGLNRRRSLTRRSASATCRPRSWTCWVWEQGLPSPENRSPDSGGLRSEGARSPRDDDPVVSELMAPNPAWPNQGRSPASRGPLVSLADDDFVYIRNEGDGSEQLFDERGDPQELTTGVGSNRCGRSSRNSATVST